ncbi:MULTISPECIES: hypothetical protein [Spirulina sp. CCY15215]|uniref:hypothetical protein n=1 Tax=Spirulina sp. CCY15215 TaxID=2767591 RepID=UPI001EF35BAD|nr:hypothetical protein [Spirulina major]
MNSYQFQQIQMTILICPGIHPPELTQSFIENLGLTLCDRLLILPPTIPPYSGIDVLNFLNKNGDRSSPLLFLAFSAGVVGAILAALAWQIQGGTIRALIALDGWGVPLAGNFPLYRLSHDYFTHWSGALLGSGEQSFYADPGVEHWELWRSPNTVTGWHQTGNHKTRCYAHEFLLELLQPYDGYTV